jgi:hypothetical protein
MTAVLADRRELTRSLSAFAAFQQAHFYLPSPHNCTRVEGGAGLAELNDASHFHDRRFFPPLCKASGLFMVRIHAGKALSVLVKHGEASEPGPPNVHFGCFNKQVILKSEETQSVGAQNQLLAVESSAGVFERLHAA